MTGPVDLPRFDAAPAALPAEELTSSEVGELLSTLTKAFRASQLYQAKNPMYQRFLGAIQDAFRRIWERAPSLRLMVEEQALRWQEQKISVGEGRESFAFLFYKDGIRSLTFLPGFEDEVERFMAAVSRARQIDQSGDDLVTLLWEQEFQCFQYGYVDMLAEGVEMYEAKGTGLETVQPQQIAAQVNAEVQETAAAGEEQSAQPVTEAAAISREDFEETLYFLDASELEKLQQEVKTEIERDLKTDVLNALFDRLEDGNAARQLEILGVLRQLLPIFMSRGDLASATLMLRELDGLLGRDLLTGEARAEVDHLFEELSEPSILGQLIQTIEEGGINPAAEELSLFFMNLRPAALPLLIRTAEVTQQAGFRARLQAAIDRLAGQHRDAIVALLQDTEATVAGGAARLVARLKVSEAAPLLAALLQRPEPALRLSAVDALVGLPSAVGMKALEQALEDESRDVRIAAARGLGALKWQSSRGRFEEVLQARTLREADLTEKIAFFEAYGALGPESVALLDRFLNGKGMLGRRQPPEIRACAALALGKVATPAARKALQQASSETDPVVRSAVQRALRQETPAT